VHAGGGPQRYRQDHAFIRFGELHPLASARGEVQDLEGIWLQHPNVVTLEARPVPSDSTIPHIGYKMA